MLYRVLITSHTNARSWDQKLRDAKMQEGEMIFCLVKAGSRVAMDLMNLMNS